MIVCVQTISRNNDSISPVKRPMLFKLNFQSIET